MKAPDAAAKAARKLTIFVKEYLLDQNGTRAAIAAGYAPKSAHVTASRLLRNAKVKAEIDKAIAQRAEKLEITAEKVLRELALMGFANMADYIRVHNGDAYVDLSKLSREQATAIQEITVEEYTEGRGPTARDVKRTRFKLSDKRGSLELLGRHLKLFQEKHQHEHTGTVEFVNDGGIINKLLS